MPVTSLKAKPIVVKDLVKTFGEGVNSVKAVDGICLTVEPGEILLIMGPSGSGKTTFLSMLGGLLKVDSGQILLDGGELTELSQSALADIRASKLGFVYQAFNLLEALTVKENILLPTTLIKQDRSQVIQRCEHLVNQLGLAHRLDAYPKTLSGGERQRVAIARALINQPKVILADEPTGNLDSQSGQEVLMLLHDIARDQGVAVLIVTHDSRVEEIADRILWLEDGKIVDRKQEAHNWVKDPVCGMKVDEWRASLVATVEGTRYAFCSERCQQRFLAQPQQYLD